MSWERKRAEARGRRAEKLAAWYLRLQGWRLLDRRVKTARGEIDLVMRRGKMVCFIEVKWRENRADLDMTVDKWRLRRVVAAAEAAIPMFVKPGDDVRIDVIQMAPRRWPRRIANISQEGA